MTIALSPQISSALASGAVVAYSVSGGKDSSVAEHAVNAYLDSIGHPRTDRVAIHADLGRIEWRESHDICAQVSDMLGVPLRTVRHSKHDMISRWEERFRRGKARYENLEIFNLIGPWSSASLRFCTAEMKQQVISPALKKLFPGRTIISVIGVRRGESPARASAQISRSEPRWDGRDGTRLMSWNPILELSEEEVFAYHRRHGIPLHPAYRLWGCSRVSCRFCVLQKHSDQVAAARDAAATPVYQHLVRLEAESTFSFQPTRWLADVAPQLLPSPLADWVARGKVWAQERRSIEAAMPKGLRYTKGWPTRLPTMDEAQQVADGRATILAHHDLDIRYPTARSIVDRFAELMAQKADRLAA